MVLGPRDKGILADGEPDNTTAPLTVITAEAFTAVGVTVIEVMALTTVAV
jgi:hypothetical protein